MTRQHAAFIGLHAYVAGHAILGTSYLDTDLSTGQPTGVPEGAGQVQPTVRTCMHSPIGQFPCRSGNMRQEGLALHSYMITCVGRT